MRYRDRDGNMGVFISMDFNERKGEGERERRENIFKDQFVAAFLLFYNIE